MTQPSADAIKSAFTFQAFDNIVGEPTYDTLYKLETQATRNAATVTVRLTPPHTNLSGIVEQPAVYSVRVGSPFPRPPYPGDAPNIQVGETVVQRTNTQNVFNIQTRNYNICQITENLLKTMVENAIEHPYLAGIHSTILGFGTRTLQDIFLHLYQSYGRISPAALKANSDKLNTPLPPHLPMALIFRQIEDCQRFSTAGGTPFTAAQLVKAAETLVLATGRYPQAYREWLNRLEVEKTFNNFRIQFNKEYQIQNEMQHTTAQQQGYAGNVTSVEGTLDNAVADFAQATAADREAFTSLTSTNANLQGHLEQVSAHNNDLQEQITNMQIQMHQMNLAQRQNNTRVQPTQTTRPPMQQPPYPASQCIPTQPVMPQPQVQWKNAQYPWTHPQQRAQRTRRNMWAPRAHTRGNTWAPRQMQQTPSNGNQFTTLSQPKSIVKRHNNWNYCFSHGFDVGDDHHSENCRNPGWNHNWQATRANTMGGSNRNRHKTQLPDQQMGPYQGGARNAPYGHRQQNPY